MTDYPQRYQLWDEFLATWPLSRLKTMTLPEYTESGSFETFTYWLESKLDKLGSIWGGSAFKFGIFSRKDLGKRESNSGKGYSENYGWYSKFGEDEAEAFEHVRKNIITIVEWAQNGDIDAIEQFSDMGAVLKWKIAFLYQNKKLQPILPIFKREPLALYINKNSEKNMATLQKEVLKEMPPHQGILEFSKQIWEEWSLKKIDIWKLSHGDGYFSVKKRTECLEKSIVMIKDGDEQAKKFMDAPIGTLFFLCHSKSLQLIGQFTSISSQYENDTNWLKRNYKVLKQAIRNDKCDIRSKWAPGGQSTFWQVDTTNLPDFEEKLLKPYFNIDLAELASIASQADFTEEYSEEILNQQNEDLKSMNQLASTCFNRIYYGTPGTGKTYTLMQLLKRDYTSQIDEVSDDELYSNLLLENFSNLTWWETIFVTLHYLRTPATLKEILSSPIIQNKIKFASNKNIDSTIRSVLQRHTIEESANVANRAQSEPHIFAKTEDKKWKLAGDWQEICADLIELIEDTESRTTKKSTIQRYSFVTFHQSYGYEEFIEGIRPVLRDEDTNNVGGEVKYEMKLGVFKELCIRARSEPNQRFAMVIDEINRGNISKIFGELITLIEPDKRDPMDGNPPPLEINLAYSGEKFSIPANIDIIGTMNTADRSLALLDIALRRRFDFVPLLPDLRDQKVDGDEDSAPLADLLINTRIGNIDVRAMLEMINKRIEVLYDKDHCIGHAYFTSLKNIENDDLRFQELGKIFKNRIIPLLEEYFFNDLHKVRLILGDNQKNRDEQFIIEDESIDSNLNELFGKNHSFDNFSLNNRYVIQSESFSNPAAYVEIYKL